LIHRDVPFGSMPGVYPQITQISADFKEKRSAGFGIESALIRVICG
jgi:hypothetical protein